MRIACLIQARMGSKRLPGKIAMPLGGRTLLEQVILRCETTGLDVWVAWPENGFDENDVLGRYARKATEMDLDAIVRVTGDCPLLDPKCISDVLCLFQSLLYHPYIYVTNDYPRTYPCGLGVEIFSRQVLERTNREATDPADREHVSLFMQRDSRNLVKNITCPINGLSDLKLSVDTQADLDFVRAIYAAKPRDYSLAATLEAVDRVNAAWEYT